MLQHCQMIMQELHWNGHWIERGGKKKIKDHLVPYARNSFIQVEDVLSR